MERLPRDQVCVANVRYHNKYAELDCLACDIHEKIGQFPHNNGSSVSDVEIKQAAVLEIPDICPRLSDLGSPPQRARLPVQLR